MSAPIDIVHPAPLRFVRQGSRKPEDDCVQIRTPLNLVTNEPVEFRHFGAGFVRTWDKRELFEHEGRIWTALAAGTRSGRSRGVRPFELKAWLSDPGQASDIAQAITRSLGGTPLARTRVEMRPSVRHAAHAGWNTTISRGEPEGGIAVRTIVHDGADMARTAVRGFIADRLRIAGQKVFVQVVPFARFTSLNSISILFDAGLQVPVMYPDLIARPDRAGDLVADWSTEPARFDADVRRASRAVPPGLLDEAVLGLVANLLPRIAIGLVDGTAGLRGLDRGIHASLRGQAEGVRADARFGEIGGVAEWEPAILRAAQVLGAIADAYPDGPEARTARRLHLFVHRRVAKLFDAPLEASDVEAIHSAFGVAP